MLELAIAAFPSKPPDKIVVCECKEEDILTMMQTINTGYAPDDSGLVVNMKEGR